MGADASTTGGSLLTQLVQAAAREPLRSVLPPLRGAIAGTVFRSLPLRVEGGRFRLYVNPRDATAILAYAFGVFERRELSLAAQLVRPGDRVLDIGANVGYHTLKFASYCGPSGGVDAFEPDPTNFAILRRNVTENGLPGVRLHEFALSDRDAEVPLFRAAHNAGDYSLAPRPDATSPPVTVRCRRLDQVAGLETPAPRLIKIDVQGFEGMVLEGAQRRFETWQPRPSILLEFEPDNLRRAGARPEELLERLRRMDYRVAPILARELTALRPEQDREYAPWAGLGCNLLAVPEEDPRKEFPVGLF